MIIRDASNDDWPLIYPFFSQIVAEGRTIAYPEGLSSSEAAEIWMAHAPSKTVVAVDTGGQVLGSAVMGPNRPGRGAHIATATFMVDPEQQGQGVGRALGHHTMSWSRQRGFLGIQFNAVVETNEAAVHLWTALGMRIVGTVPKSFRHPAYGLVGLHVMFQEFGQQ